MGRLASGAGFLCLVDRLAHAVAEAGASGDPDLPDASHTHGLSHGGADSPISPPRAGRSWPNVRPQTVGPDPARQTGQWALTWPRRRAWTSKHSPDESAWPAHDPAQGSGDARMAGSVGAERLPCSLRVPDATARGRGDGSGEAPPGPRRWPKRPTDRYGAICVWTLTAGAGLDEEWAMVRGDGSGGAPARPGAGGGVGAACDRQ